MQRTKQTILALLLALLVSLVLVGCGNTNYGVVTPIGGCIYGPDDVSICFPAQSLKSAAAFEITVLEDEPDSVMKPATHVYQLTPNTPLLVKEARVTVPFITPPKPPTPDSVLTLFN